LDNDEVSVADRCLERLNQRTGNGADDGKSRLQNNPNDSSVVHHENSFGWVKKFSSSDAMKQCRLRIRIIIEMCLSRSLMGINYSVNSELAADRRNEAGVSK
jgi:hypothetical protein